MKKRIICLLLAALAVLALCAPAMAAEEPADQPEPARNLVESGKCGTLSWKVLTDTDRPGSFTGSYTLYITGSGAMPDFSSADAVPWSQSLFKLLKVELPSGLTNIGSYAFYGISRGWGGVTVEIPSTVKKIGKMAFANALMSSITIPSGVTSIGAGAFSGCSTTVKILNPDCAIAESSAPGNTLGDPRYATVIGYSDSTAQAYAKKWGYTFKSLGAAPGRPAKKGWVTENGQKYYYQNGKKLMGIWIISGKRYYFSPADGHMMTGLIRTDAKGTLKYFSVKDGHMLTGLVTTNANGTQRYFSVKDGHMMKGGWIYVGGKPKYYANANGVITQKR